ncbi:MAG: GNAT family N-acetyltransferase [Rhodospirillaceae bacterium]|nr:GNAT family N-acetyltransferase [Rhodospirillaceae bacterium]
MARPTTTPEHTIGLRDAKPEDFAAIADIYAHHVLHGLASFEEEPPDAAEMKRRWQALTGDDHPFFVAECAGRIVGYAYAGPYRLRPAYRYTVENSVYIRPGEERQGVGKALLEALIEACEARGLRQMIAVIGDSDHDASIGLHEALGFRLVGTLDAVGFKHGRWVDSVLMQRALGAGGDTLPEA